MHARTHAHTDNGPSKSVSGEKLSEAMLPQVSPSDYDIIFTKDELDKANKDKKKRFPPGFKVRMYSRIFRFSWPLKQ